MASGRKAAIPNALFFRDAPTSHDHEPDPSLLEGSGHNPNPDPGLPLRIVTKRQPLGGASFLASSDSARPLFTACECEKHFHASFPL
jgi:hypothetical protein